MCHLVAILHRVIDALSKSRFCAIAILTVSGAATLAGLGCLVAFNGTPGRQAAGPAVWPVRSAIKLSPTVPTIILFAHPMCSCTAATLEELDRVVLARRPSPAVRILFVRSDPAWKPNDLWRRAEKLSGASVEWDEDSREARLFGAQISGLVFLYNTKGNLLFQGGITGSRGHSGDNYGAERLGAALDTGRSAAVSRSPVFGCALFSTSEQRGLER
jgi:hypothetical protein